MESIRRIRKIERRCVKKSQTSFISWFFVIIMLLAASLFFLVLNKVWGDIQTPLNTGLSGALPADSSVNVTEILDQTSSSTLLYDSLLPFLLIGLFSFVLILAGTMMDHPLMIIVGIIIAVVVLMLAVIYSNLYESISGASGFTDTASDMSIQQALMQYLPYIIFIMAIGIGVSIIWSRRSGGSGSL